MFFFWELRNMFLSFSFSFVVDEVLEFLKKKTLKFGTANRRRWEIFRQRTRPMRQKQLKRHLSDESNPTKKAVFCSNQKYSGNLPNYLKTNLSKVSEYEDIPQNCGKKPYQHMSPEKGPFQKDRIVFQPSLFRGFGC